MKKALFLIAILAIAAGGYYWYANYYVQADAATSPVEQKIVGSGVIEAKTVLITSETGGRIVDVFALEGTEVAAGDLLVQLDDSQLEAQRVELEAAITTAQENLVAAKAMPQPADIAVAVAEVAQAQALKDGAYQIWQELLRMKEEPQDLLVPIRDLQAQIIQAEKAIEFAEVEQQSAVIQEENAARDQSSFGKLNHQIIQKHRKAADVSVQLANANLQALRTQLAHLWEQYNNPVALQTQANQAEAEHRMAETAVALANAQLAAAKKRPRPEDIAVAEAWVRVAESGRVSLENQRANLALTSPRAGLISTRAAEPGEIAVPGAILLSVADLDQVTLRVFIPETLIGKVQLGQTARVTVDSVKRPFEGLVTFIANEAEFTPQNVQIAEERVNLVFAVEISLENPGHTLKPGMPADAEFLP
ncbi:MAG: efflux RND transporter periplasmic adaptor subunit [Chloroflexota bacterium]|nr:efflux RND transporter periplasmic adaptor subunit [Chloroflexota bacterium]